MNRPTLWLSLLIVFFARAEILPGDVIITVGDATVVSGGTAFVDVFVRHDGTGSDQLGFYSFQSFLTTTGPTLLDFVPIQPDPQVSDPDYVFFGDSTGPPVGSGFKSPPTNNFFNAYSAADASLTDVTLPATDVLLARMQVADSNVLTPVPGDTFTVTFDDLTAAFADSTLSSFLGINLADSDFTGTVTIASAAIPEPSAFSLLLIGLVGFGVRSHQKHRRSESPSRS
ncbi:MAG: PEP-CTERM sorting domain-containing protein [Planctomycetaceae bacterium]